MMKLWSKILLGLSMLIFIDTVQAQRIEISLDGQWEVEEGVEPNDIPLVYSHSVSVTGLSHQAILEFPDVDHFGVAVWLNVGKIGEHLGCFTAGKFELNEAIR